MLSVDVYVCLPPNNVWTPALNFMKFGMYVMPPEVTSVTYLKNSSHQL
jgi:hypothetical protein